MWRELLLAYRKARYRNGCRIQGTIGYDAHIEIEVVDSSRLAAGLLVIRYRRLESWEPKGKLGDFSSPQEVPVSKLWDYDTYMKGGERA